MNLASKPLSLIEGKQRVNGPPIQGGFSVQISAFSLLSVVAFSLAATSLSACCGGSKDKDTPVAEGGCTKDNDCKGHRVCQAGHCVDSSAGNPTNTAVAQPRAPVQTVAQPTPQPIPQPVAQPSNPYAMANDGLPVEIPPPGSKPPTVAEWNAVPREISVRHSTPLNCETRMLREWLKVTCRQKGGMAALDMSHVSQSGQQVFLFNKAPDLASVVVQVVRGKTYQARYTYQTGRERSTSDLIVSWPNGNPRPSIAFTNPP
jgi:hypothetical protein